LQANNVIISNGRLFEPGHTLHKQIVFIHIVEGVILKISPKPISGTSQIQVDATGSNIMPGMFDLRCQLKDPGLEHQEDIESGCLAASAGGFTGIAVQPTTEPITQTKSLIEYVIKRSESLLPQIIPVGAATLDLASEEITEMYDMKKAGARAFSNGDEPYQSGGSLMRVLMYASTIDSMIMSHAQDKYLSGDGVVNESETTIHTGLKQQPSLAEITQISKELEIAKYAKSSIHFSHISCAESVEIIRKAKQGGVKVSCDVSIWHLVFTDEKVLDFDSNFKVNPPFRSEIDRVALVEGVNNGTIDAIVSDHNPHNIENKLVEFDYASYGITGFQTFFSVYNEHLHSQINMETWFEKTVVAPRKLLGIDVPSIKEGNVADMWVSDPKKEWTFNNKSNLSKSKNNPFWNQKLVGACTSVVRGDLIEIFDI
jgi:dihydroorotase